MGARYLRVSMSKATDPTSILPNRQGGAECHLTQACRELVPYAVYHDCFRLALV